MKTNNLKGTLILGVASLIWGMAFVAQNMISDTIPSFTVNASRSFIAAIFLYIFWKITTRKKKVPFFPKDKAQRKKYLGTLTFC